MRSIPYKHTPTGIRLRYRLIESGQAELVAKLDALRLKLLTVVSNRPSQRPKKQA